MSSCRRTAKSRYIIQSTWIRGKSNRDNTVYSWIEKEARENANTTANADPPPPTGFFYLPSGALTFRLGYSGTTHLCSWVEGRNPASAPTRPCKLSAETNQSS